MTTYEMTGETVAEPIACLGLNVDMLPLNAGVFAPRVVVPRDVDSPPLTYADLDAEVYRLCRIV